MGRQEQTRQTRQKQAIDALILVLLRDTHRDHTYAIRQGEQALIEACVEQKRTMWTALDTRIMHL